MGLLIGMTLAGVFISIVVGTLWHMPQSPMGKLHMRYLGFDQLSPEEQKRKIEESKPKMPKIYGAQMLLSLLMSFAVVLIVSMSMKNGVALKFAMGFVLLNWLCFMVPVVGGNILWGTCDPKLAWKKFFSDSGYQLVTVLLIAFITSLFV